MPINRPQLIALNRGEVGADAMGRVDVDRLRLSAETFLNFLPKTLGPMQKRPGTIYRGITDGDNAAQFLEFVAAADQVAAIEVTNAKVRVWESDPLTPVTFASVSTSINNDDFAAQGSWVISGSTNGGTCAFSSKLQLQPGARGAVARCVQEVTVSGGDISTEHCLKIVVPSNYDGAVLRVGSTDGDDDYVEETRLLAGEHFLSFTPSGNFFITFLGTHSYGAELRVTSCEIHTGDMDITAPWVTADLSKIQGDQSADVLFIFCDGYAPYRIERRGSNMRSWSVVEHYHPDGPFVGKTAKVQIKVNQTYGRPTLTADQAFFDSGHVGTLLRLFHDGQNFTMLVAGDAVFCDPIRVSGIEGQYVNEREFTLVTSGTWSGTVHFMRSTEGPDIGYGVYPKDADAATATDITTNATFANQDEDDNLVVWYRAGFEDGDYTSGQVSLAFTYGYGGAAGILRVSAVASGTSASAEVLKLVRGTTYTALWAEGAWSSLQGFPSCGAIFQGRLFFCAGSQIWGSVSDNFESFDQENLTDSGPIDKFIAKGPVDNIHFALDLDVLLLGTASQILAIHSTADSGIITPTAFGIKTISEIGTKAFFPASKLSSGNLTSAIAVDRSGWRLRQLTPQGQGVPVFDVADLTLLHPKILRNGSGVVSMAVQQLPEQRVHCVLSDGSVAILTYDKAEDVIAWARFTTGTSGVSSSVERVFILPGNGAEDRVFYVVNRNIDGSTKRFIEEWATEDKLDGDNECYLSDACAYYNGVSTTTPSGFDHFDGEQVVVWADGDVVMDSGSPKLHTVSSGQITLSTAASTVVAGLNVKSQWKSTKLAYAAGGGSALLQHKNIRRLGLLLGTTHHNGMTYGRDFTTMEALPQEKDGAVISSGTIHDEFDEPMTPFPGDWDTDMRICLESDGPFPVTVKAVVFDQETNG